MTYGIGSVTNIPELSCDLNSSMIRLYCIFTVIDYSEEKLLFNKGKILSMIFEN